MPISKEEVSKIAALSNLALTPEETESFSVQLAAIVEYIDQLSEVDITNVAPWQHQSTGEASTSFAARDDCVAASLGTDIALANAPDPDAGHFAVPKVIGG
ncbi:MAG: Asp-tRNA(Asn)/Glu-tRNA(Gln) amidotransferase subunit GatC [Blastocatellia bacterium]